MTLSSYLSPEAVEPSLQARDRRGVLAELAALLQKNGSVPAGTDLVTILENREELGSTGIGGGAAIPHVRLKNLARIHVAVGRSPAGIDFSAIDGEPVRLFFLLVAPENATGDHLKALARISRLLRQEGVRKALMEAPDGAGMLDIIVTEDEKEA
jgi:PTS system nitrogen regulatory IIA component